jgi:predicted acyl esterase
MRCRGVVKAGRSERHGHARGMRAGVAFTCILPAVVAHAQSRDPHGVREVMISTRELVDQAVFFAEHGFVAVVQDCRGRHRAQGTFVKYVNEPKDGYDTAEWLAKVRQADGRTSMWGTSCMAHVRRGPQS